MTKKRPKVVTLRTAVRDIVEIADDIARGTSLAAADRFLTATRKTFEQLARMPGIGGRWVDDDTEPAEVRLCPVANFKKYRDYRKETRSPCDSLENKHLEQNGLIRKNILAY